MTSGDLKVATSVNFALLDIRTSKRPRLLEIFKDAKGSRREDSPAIFEIDISKRSDLKIQDLDKLLGFHIVIVCSEFGENNLPVRPHENELLRRIIEITKKQSFVGLLQGGAAELFRTREEMKIITLWSNLLNFKCHWQLLMITNFVFCHPLLQICYWSHRGFTQTPLGMT